MSFGHISHQHRQIFKIKYKALWFLFKAIAFEIGEDNLSIFYLRQLSLTRTPQQTVMNI